MPTARKLGPAAALANLARVRWGRDERTRSEAGLLLLQRAAARLLPGYRITEYGKTWGADQEFFHRLRAFDDSDRSSDRRFLLRELVKLIDDVPGDTAEAGVFEGASSWLICEAVSGSGRTHFAFDSFEGLSEVSGVDGRYWSAGDMRADEAAVRQKLTPFGARVEKGWIPDVFAAADDRRFSFVHVDVDLYEPTRDSMEFFYPRLNPGGVLVCDDYGFATCPGATRAVDEYMAERPEPVLHVPTGQGVVVKG